MEEIELPITEKSNDITKDLDILEPIQMLRLFRQTDSQIFSGWSYYPSLMDNEIIFKIIKLSNFLNKLLEEENHEDFCVIISGAGTSGRLAYFCCQQFNEILKQFHIFSSSSSNSFFQYLIAGGDKALVTAQEQKEDDTEIAILDLKKLLKNKKKVIFIGISCGFSAPYIASQLNYIMDRNNISKYICALIGFNPVYLARNTSIEKWNKTFRQVALRLEKLEKETDNYMIINPIIGPEPLTGSTRMKSGSTTKILLETIFATGIKQYLFKKNKIISSSNLIFNDPYEIVYSILKSYEIIFRETYFYIEELSSILKLAGESLKNEGHIYYLAQTSTFGIMGFIDASECPPTFGADINDIKCFIYGGWKVINNKEGDLSHIGPEYNIELNDQFCPTEKDIVILFHLKSEFILESIVQFIKKCKLNGANTVVLTFSKREGNENKDNNFQQIKNIVDFYINIKLSYIDLFEDINLHCGIPSYAELSLKFILNAISTVSHIIKGKVFKNRMIDLKVSNNKLFERSIRIISICSSVSRDIALECLLKSIYRVNNLNSIPSKDEISEHIKNAYSKSKVIPIALLLATGKFTVETAQNILDKEPIVSYAMKYLN